MFDPLEKTEEIRKEICRGLKKKYFRFRSTEFYGGISTGDCVGCNLGCVFCWNYNRNKRFGEIGEFYSPKSVCKQLMDIVKREGYRKVRVTGGEPTIGRRHLFKLLSIVPQDILFLLETNGILLAKDDEYLKRLKKFKNLHIRVSLKGKDSREFSKLTRAKPRFFKKQLVALEKISRSGISYNASVISLKDEIDGLRKRLAKIDSGMMLEEEEIKLYPHVKKRLKRFELIN